LKSNANIPVDPAYCRRGQAGTWLLELDLFLDCLNSSASALTLFFHLNLERTTSRTGVRDEMSEGILLIKAYSPLYPKDLHWMQALIVNQELSLKNREA